MKNKNGKHRRSPNVKGPEILSFGFWLCVLCFTCLPLRLLTSIMGTASASSTAGVVRKSSPSGGAVAEDPNSSPQRQLWRADISLARGQEDERSSDKLRRMIEQVRAVGFTPPKQIVVPVEVLPPEPDEAPSGATVESEVKREKPKPRLPYEPITENTLQTLRNLSRHPEKVDSPFELAETLFLSGNLKEAAVFYTEAIGRTEPNDVSSSRDRAWMLFQMGNCLRNSDLSAATKMYARLFTEYPDSPWADMARAQAQLIDWYIRDEPRKLIDEVKETGGK
ncbi:MAG: hypothetical protein U9Q07_11950 [Planctomycetota bacterium]|nr:hypothetical protein [Planctomycetota bacterium]